MKVTGRRDTDQTEVIQYKSCLEWKEAGYNISKIYTVQSDIDYTSYEVHVKNIPFEFNAEINHFSHRLGAVTEITQRNFFSSGYISFMCELHEHIKWVKFNRSFSHIFANFQLIKLKPVSHIDDLGRL